jgi:hypothetical protein
VAQASFQWRYLVSLIQDSPLADVSTATLKYLSRQRGPSSGRWLLVTSGMAALLFWDGRLVLATSVGVATMVTAYLLQDGQWQLPAIDLRKWLQGWNKPFLLAVTSGGVATLGTYMAASIWVETSSHWVATLMILQGGATLGLLGLMLWQTWGKSVDRPVTQVSQLLPDLTAVDPLKRLIAIHQITDLLEHPATEQTQRRQMADYFRLMLSREPEAIVREALLEGLQAASQAQAISPTRGQPLVMPLAKQRSRPSLTADLRQPEHQSSQLEHS